MTPEEFEAEWLPTAPGDALYWLHDLDQVDPDDVRIIVEALTAFAYVASVRLGMALDDAGALVEAVNAAVDTIREGEPERDAIQRVMDATKAVDRVLGEVLPG